MNRWNGKTDIFYCPWWSDTYDGILSRALEGSSTGAFLFRTDQKAAATLERLGVVTIVESRAYLTETGILQAQRLREHNRC